MTPSRRWTIYLAQDKHLDYNWCGTPVEVEARMAALLDYYLEQTARAGSRWNLDSTIWLDVYRRQRGEAGAQRLLDAIREGRIGYAANDAVLLWGLMSTELAIRACYGSAVIEQSTQTRNKTALIMENPGLIWGAANVLTECGFCYLGRGILDLRAKTYIGQRDRYPLFWWRAPNGRRILVRWDLYQETRSWGGYAEAFRLAEIAGEGWDALHVQSCPDRNTPEVYRKRKEFIHQTVQRYAAYGDTYPISSILLLGTGWDNWTMTDDYRAFVQRFNLESDGRIRMVDARYEEFFEAAQAEIKERGLEIPNLEGSFGICWEEWAAHLAGPTRDFREGERLLRRAEAAHALAAMGGKEERAGAEAIRRGWRALLSFAEHDFGGCNRAMAAVSAGVRAGAAVEALTTARALSPDLDEAKERHQGQPTAESTRFAWQGGRVTFCPERCAVASLMDQRGREWVPTQCGLGLGEFVRTLYRSDSAAPAIFPEIIPSPSKPLVERLSLERDGEGVHIRVEGEHWGFRFATHWVFHAVHPWMDVTYDLEGGWSEQAQSVQFCFPLVVERPVYRYDVAGAILVAGPAEAGGDDLPGANPVLFAAQSFAAAHGADQGAILLTPDAPLVQFGPDAVALPGACATRIPAQIVSMPLMNLTRNDWQLGQGGQRRWRFRYRLVFSDGGYEPLGVVREAQHFCTPPFLQVPGEGPVLAGLDALEVRFDGGPVTAFKAAEDGERLIVRLWNVLDQPVRGSLRLPAGFAHAQRCDALERPKDPLAVEQGRAQFDVERRGILTLALCREDE